MIQMVLCYGHAEFTRTCIRSIYENTPPEEIHLVVWENLSKELLTPADINPENTVLLSMDQNYGCATALNALIKDFGLGCGQDVMYISNDHYVFPGWIKPLLENSEGFHAISPMHPFGLPGLHSILVEKVEFHHDSRGQYLDHPESSDRIREFLHLIYGPDLQRFVQEQLADLPEVCTTGQFWAGCFFLRKDILDQVGLFRTDRGLAGDEDQMWVDENIRGKHSEGVYSKAYIHHFQSITTNRNHLTMDHGADEFTTSPVPPISDSARALVQNAVRRMKGILAKTRK